MVDPREALAIAPVAGRQLLPTPRPTARSIRRRGGAACLVVPLYQNRSKAGNLALLRRFASGHGFGLVAFANRHDVVGDEFFDDVQVVDFADRAAVRAGFAGWLRGHRPAGVFCLGEDEVPLCADLAAEAGLPGNGRDAAMCSRSKQAMRTVLRAAGVPMPRSFPVGSLPVAQRLLAEELRGGPAFLKPVLGTGSMYCRQVDDADTLAAAWPELFDASRRSAASDPLYREVFGGGYVMLLEELIGTYALPDAGVLGARLPVHELSVEAVVDAGRAHVYGVTDKLLPPGADGREHLWRTSRLPAGVRRALAQRIQVVVAGLGLRVGAVHVEFRLEPARGRPDAVIGGVPVQATLLEAAARMGGAYMQSFWLRATGFDPVGWLAAQACRLPAPPPQISVVHPSVMANLWPQATGELRAVSGLAELATRAGPLLDEVVIYDRVGERVEAGPGAERGIGHAAVRDADLDVTTAPAAAAYERLEELYLYAHDHVRGLVAHM